ncbi:MAG: hypothetical protein R3E83_12910 [Burkholderiaceae bacterium]
MIELTSHKRRMLGVVLDELFAQIDLTDSQYETAKARYEAVSAWLADGESPFLQDAAIYAQGSIAVGTANKPIGRAEFDVDLVCHLPSVGVTSSPAAVKALIGDRPAPTPPTPRCSKRSSAAGGCATRTSSTSTSRRRFAIRHAATAVSWCPTGRWRREPTNPKGYAARFERYAALRPRLTLREAAIAASVRTWKIFPSRRCASLR